jgi:REP element-mobilizing transposase RayT
LLAPGVGYYHVISRIAGQRFLMDAEEKNRLMELLYRAAEFSGVDVLTFALMDNHFHLMLRVPQARPVDDADLVRRMRVLYGEAKTQRVLEDWDRWEKKGEGSRVVKAKALLRERLFDLSEFCKTLKQHYSMSYNLRHGYSGSIWGARFKSMILSADYETLMTVGAYIELNPVRASVVHEARDYAWSGCGQAFRGHAGARRGLRLLVSAAYARRETTFEQACLVYGSAIQGFIERPSAQGLAPSGRRPAAPAFESEAVEEKLEAGEALALYELLRCRVRHFSAGLALGPLAFVRQLVKGLSPASKDTARRCGHCKAVDLYTARWLRGGEKVSLPRRRQA